MEPVSLRSTSPTLSCNDVRTLSDIIWSCTATLFACTWTAIHPNIPGMDEGKVAIVLRRLFMMVIALLAPELIITWATLQFFSAQKATKDFNDTFGAQYDGYRKWAVTHEFFAWMGGFYLYKFVSDGFVDMPDIAEADLLDRSKGDELSKSVAILQLLWFVVQLIARWVQKLPVTLLEVYTLSVVALACIFYALWWKKPKDVGRPCIVRWKAESPPTNLVYGPWEKKSAL
ncbi:hypothetical protein K503DRAFT_792920 [Rhizopogon vinicolor AM-OR11-026]|uniref:Uncharacterized protein n=1 Tax=Rhizopogon vinicolor AM-OR11-026 TaxID=1314800 RepID=A0A1B7MY08_9AGAM|nr:hypothetical protein K503DRAFT_792920 [Rhizopogon vinicolor AM-OR11-026]